MPLTKLNSASVIERLPVGSVLQTVVKQYATGSNATGSSYISTGFFGQITPIFSNSKILVIPSFSTHHIGNNAHGVFTMYRDITSSTNVNTIISGGTDLTTVSGGFGMGSNYENGGGNNNSMTTSVLNLADTTNQITYTIAYKTYNGGTVYFLPNGNYGSFLLQEIKQ